jgi:hypothetical protein
MLRPIREQRLHAGRDIVARIRQAALCESGFDEVNVIFGEFALEDFGVV